MESLNCVQQFTYGLVMIGWIITTLAVHRVMRHTYHRSSKYLPLRDCPKSTESGAVIEIQELYMHPALKPFEVIEHSSVNLEELESPRETESEEEPEAFEM